MSALQVNPKSKRHKDPSQQTQVTKNSESPLRDNFPPSFWDNLSKVHLTSRALRELDRRSGIASVEHRPAAFKRLQSTDIRIFACHGGPDLRHIIKMPTTKLACKSRRTAPNASADELMRPRKCSAYCENFETHLKDYRIYMANSASRPMNEEQTWATLSVESSAFPALNISREDFEQFQKINRTLSSEACVTTHLFPAICGGDLAECQPNVLFANMAPIAGKDIAAAKPDFFYGSHRDCLNKEVLEGLLSFIAPTLGEHDHVVPNFYAELKGPRGCPSVLERQACFDGAHGARAMHWLQNYGLAEPGYDGNAYTYSATYHPKPGILQLFAHHTTKPTTPDGLPEYHMTLIDCLIMTRDIQTFRTGISAFRNVRDLARRHREAFIEAANARARQSITELGHQSSISKRPHMQESSFELAPAKRRC